MINKIKSLISVLLLTFAIASCDNGGDCSIYNVAYYRTLFYNAISGENNKEQPYQFYETINVSLVINGKDSVVANHLTEATELTLPMCYTRECDTVVLHIGENVEDTLFVEHTNIPMFLSMDCGTAMYHNITAIRHTNNYIDSVAIVHPFVDFDAHENVKLYITE